MRFYYLEMVALRIVMEIGLACRETCDAEVVVRADFRGASDPDGGGDVVAAHVTNVLYAATRGRRVAFRGTFGFRDETHFGGNAESVRC